MSTPAIQRFHAHCDKCAQCMNNPFALCPTGYELFVAAANSTNPPPPKPKP